MNGNNRLLLMSIGWTTLVLVTLLVAVPETRSAPVVFAFGMLFAGWLFADRCKVSVASEPSAPTDSRGMGQDIAEHAIVAIIRVSREFLLQFDQIRGEVAQTQGILGDAIGQLMASFQQVSAQVWGLQRLSRQSATPCGDNILGAAPAGGELEAIAREIEVALDQAVISLQFQDIVSQLLGYVARRLDVLEEIAADQESLALVLRDTRDPASATRAIEAIREHVETLSQKLSALKQGVDNNPVSQTGYASGDVELF